MILTSTTQIRNWVNEHHGFSHGKLTYTFDHVSKVFIMILEHHPNISIAGEKEILKTFFIEVFGVDVVSGELLESEKDLTLYQLHALTDNPGLVLDVWGKDETSFKCTGLKIKEAKEEEQIAKPILNKDILAFKIHVGNKPDAVYWLKRLQENGFDAVYIGYFGNEIRTEEIKDYAGLSIRPTAKDNRLALGVKFCKVFYVDALLDITIELQNSELKDFWQVFVRILSEMEVSQVRSGNVIFSSLEWQDFLQTGSF